MLKKNGKLEFVGGDFFFNSLDSKSSLFGPYRVPRPNYSCRNTFNVRLISISSSEIIENAYDESSDVFDLLDDAEAKLFEVTQGNLKKSSEAAGSLVKQALKKDSRDW